MFPSFIAFNIKFKKLYGDIYMLWDNINEESVNMFYTLSFVKKCMCDSFIHFNACMLKDMLCKFSYKLMSLLYNVA